MNNILKNIRLVSILFILTFLPSHLLAQDKIVTLVVSGEAETKDEATKQALRSAIEQAFGSFISANTKIVNDEIIRDEIVSITNGNILNYKEISDLTMSNGNKSVTISATVSVGNLTDYAKNKGMNSELSGATFLMNKRIEEFNTRNEKTALRNTLEQYARVMPCMFDLKISVQDPIEKNNKYEIPCVIKFIANENTIQAKKLWVDALANLNVGIEYTTANGNVLTTQGRKTENYITYENFHDNIKLGAINAVESTYLKMYLRNDNRWVAKKMNKIFNDLLIRCYSIKDDLGIYQFKGDKSINQSDEAIGINYGDIIPIKSDCRWFFNNDKKGISIPSLNKTIKIGETMYEQTIVLTYSEEQLSKISNISIEPETNNNVQNLFDFIYSEDYISTDGREHLLFNGVYIDGNLERVINSLKERGYDLVKKNGEISATMKGRYLDNNVELSIQTTKSKNIVWGINVAFPVRNKWNELKSDYLRLKEYINKFGPIEVRNEEFKSPYYDGCNEEMNAVIIPQACLYCSQVGLNSGIISVIINNDKRVYLLYRDSINFTERNK